MTHVRVNDNIHYGVSRHADSSAGRWDRDDTWEEHYPESVSQVGENDYFDLSVDFELETGCEYYLLYGTYSTGDSFGHDEGCIEFVGLYKDSTVANKNLRTIEQHDETYNKLERGRWYNLSAKEKAALERKRKTFEPYMVTLLTENGNKYSVHVPWHGYFERLTNVEVKTIPAV